ncbi:MAG TPA: hypothetical protein VHE37_11985 [Nevskiaceae bacterium]|nr:hypothetical protein [Nevskiaceae bacterium]
MYTAPIKTGGYFTLTQVCLRPNDGVALQGNTVGIIVRRQSGDATESENVLGSCVTFTPGLVIPPSEQLSCVNTLGSGPSWCMLTGIKSPPDSTP